MICTTERYAKLAFHLAVPGLKLVKYEDVRTVKRLLQKEHTKQNNLEMFCCNWGEAASMISATTDSNFGHAKVLP